MKFKESNMQITDISENNASRDNDSTRFFLSGDKTTCCHSVIAVSGGHIGLLQTALNVISLT